MLLLNRLYRMHEGKKFSFKIMSVFGLVLLFLASCSNNSSFNFKKDDTIALVGNALGERMQYYGFLETYLQASFPEKNLVIRNLSYTGDRVHARPRGSENYPTPDEQLDMVNANV